MDYDKSNPLFGLKEGHKIYFVGIGGYSMYGIAQICKSLGYEIFGSDKEISSKTKDLQSKGCKVFYEHSKNNIDEIMPDCVVYSAAVPTDNPELLRAIELGILVIERSYFLGGLNKLYKKVINIAGTHGKTTTTTMCSLILDESNVLHTAHIGAKVEAWNSTVKIYDTKDLFVSEACEYNSSFLRFFSTTGAILNIDHDHIDCFPTIEDVIDVFAKFSLIIDSEGYLVIPSFDSNVKKMLEIVKGRAEFENLKLPQIITFGEEIDRYQGNSPNFYISNYKIVEGYPEFDVFYNNNYFCHINMAIPGKYNSFNALAAISCSVLNGATAEACENVLNNFKGADNRFSFKGKYKGARVISDYAHHPSAITASYNAAREITKGKVIAIFQPITYKRATGLFDEFVASLIGCPDNMILEVYTSRESGKQNFSSKLITKKINSLGGKSHFIKDFKSLKKNIDSLIKEDDTLLFMGPESLKEFSDRIISDS